MKKPSFLAKFLFWILSLLVFFLLGMSLAGISGAGEGQGLAGGAIVVGYGFIAGLAALVGSIILSLQLTASAIKRVNLILCLVLAIIIALLAYRINQKQKEERREVPNEMERSNPVPTPTQEMRTISFQDLGSDQSPMGLGLFRPNFYEHSIMYFYPQPEIGKLIDEHKPVDSLVFTHSEMDQYEISYAPPFLVPAHLKMDYDLILFRIKKLSSSHLEIIVNEKSGQTVYVDKFKGTSSFWPEFILSVTSVELLPEYPQKFRIKPLEHSSEVLIEGTHEFLKPETIQGDWMEVSFMNADYKPEGRAWIQWKQGNTFLVSYSLLF